MYTEEQVKKELPQVKVKLGNGKIVDGVISGRQSNFPSVSIKLYGTWFHIEFSWSAIVHSLNNGKPLIA